MINAPKNRKKYILRGLALFLSILLLLTDPIGYRTVYAEGEPPSESEAQVCSGEELEKPTAETSTSNIK